MRLSFDNISKQIVGEGTAIIKIDVEGGEFEVLSGMQYYITHARPIIICEILHSDTACKVSAAVEKNENIMQLLVEKKYRAFRVLKNSSQEDFLGLQEIYEFSAGVWEAHLSPYYCDYVFVPSEYKSVLELCVSSTANAYLPLR